MASTISNTSTNVGDDAPERRRFPSPEHVAKVIARVKKQAPTPVSNPEEAGEGFVGLLKMNGTYFTDADIEELLLEKHMDS